jgi:cytochrome c553
MFLRLVAGHAAAIAAAFLFAAAANAADPNLCAACHGEGGNSVDPALPSIAQQPAQFVATALFQFREGNRKDPQMSPMAANLSNAEMNELAKYFSAQKAVPPRHKSRPESAEAGPGLTKKFNCTQCHGPRLLGQQHIPRIAGQQFQYLRTQLLGFRAGKRSDIDGNMTSAAQALGALDVELLADYLAGLEPN